MKIIASEIAQVATVQMEPVEDKRGFFARQYCAQEFSDAGLNLTVVQTNISFNERRGTLRGMHYQAEPKPDPKLVHCTRGSIYDVAVDLRRDSLTFGNWFAATLDAQNRLGLYVPTGCAHGFMTLEDDTEVTYLMGEFFHPDLGAGVRWNDPAFAIEWPMQPTVISDRDNGYRDFSR